MIMFSDDVLEKIFARKELQSLDLSTQSSIIHAIEDILEGKENTVKKLFTDSTEYTHHQEFLEDMQDIRLRNIMKNRGWF